jgi:hypothetical protein
MITEQYYSDDYAGLKTGEHEFYYGYEVIDPITDEWCFQAKEGGNELCRYSESHILSHVRNRQLKMPQDFLIAGIGLWLLTQEKETTQ